MMLNLFDQFATPQILGLPLILIAMLFPTLFTPKTLRTTPNRTTAIQKWFTSTLTKQLMLPLNKPGHTWSLPLLSLFFYLLLINILGLLPYTFTPTTQLALNLGLAVPFWLMTILVGLRNQPTDALAHLLPTGTPIPLIPALIIIETISLLIRPIALGVRLTANLTAGHLLMQLISSATLALIPMSKTLSLLTLITLALLSILEMAVALIQAYVFVLLITLYLQENT
uniref:ATP synthase subunit a n=1 Tax=Aprasia parapulchella TaxID=207572 RepID=A0A067Z7R3_9SAUR|nr:ATP synthase F0 subunit 6 [Aprasia parapulchella]AHL17033.1 ATP synthase F0 subunit 6 [Aprasia parapulchella]